MSFSMLINASGLIRYVPMVFLLSDIVLVQPPRHKGTKYRILYKFLLWNYEIIWIYYCISWYPKYFWSSQGSRGFVFLWESLRHGKFKYFLISLCLSDWTVTRYISNKGLYIIPYKSLKVCYLEIREIGGSGTLQEKGLVSMNCGR